MVPVVSPLTAEKTMNTLPGATWRSPILDGITPLEQLSAEVAA